MEGLTSFLTVQLNSFAIETQAPSLFRAEPGLTGSSELQSTAPAVHKTLSCMYSSVNPIMINGPTHNTHTVIAKDPTFANNSRAHRGARAVRHLWLLRSRAISNDTRFSETWTMSASRNSVSEVAAWRMRRVLPTFRSTRIAPSFEPVLPGRDSRFCGFPATIFRVLRLLRPRHNLCMTTICNSSSPAFHWPDSSTIR